MRCSRLGLKASQPVYNFLMLTYLPAVPVLTSHISHHRHNSWKDGYARLPLPAIRLGLLLLLLLLLLLFFAAADVTCLRFGAGVGFALPAAALLAILAFARQSWRGSARLVQGDARSRKL